MFATHGSVMRVRRKNATAMFSFSQTLAQTCETRAFGRKCKKGLLASFFLFFSFLGNYHPLPIVCSNDIPFNLFSILSRLSSTLSSSTRRFPEILTHDELVIRSYSAVAHSTSLEQSTSSIVTHLDKWIEEGNKVKAAELRGIVRDLRDRGRDSIAFEVSEWVYKNRLCSFSPSDNAVQVDLIAKVRGIDAAKSYYNFLSDEQKNDETSEALKKCIRMESYPDINKWGEIDHDSTVLNYNDLICLYANLGQYKKVLDVLAEMKENGVSPDHFSYRTCFILYGMRGDINGMEKLVEEMESSQNHIEMDSRTLSVVAKYYLKGGLTNKSIVALKRLDSYSKSNKDTISYNYFISLYSSIGNKTELLRFWDLQKAAGVFFSRNDYMAMVDALVKLGGLEEAKSLVEDWESSEDCLYRYILRNTLLIGLCKKGLFEEAEALMLNIFKTGTHRICNGWARVVSGYISKKEMLKAVNCMKAALVAYSMSEEFETKIEELLSVWHWLNDEVRKVEDAETLVGSLNIEIPSDREMCAALSKAYHTMKKRLGEADGIDENEKETQSIQSTNDDDTDNDYDYDLYHTDPDCHSPSNKDDEDYELYDMENDSSIYDFEYKELDYYEYGCEDDDYDNVINEDPCRECTPEEEDHNVAGPFRARYDKVISSITRD